MGRAAARVPDEWPGRCARAVGGHAEGLNWSRARPAAPRDHLAPRRGANRSRARPAAPRDQSAQPLCRLAAPTADRATSLWRARSQAAALSAPGARRRQQDEASPVRRALSPSSANARRW